MVSLNLKQTLVAGMNTVIVVGMIYISTALLIYLGLSIDGDISLVLFSLSVAIFIAGMIGLFTKVLADGFSIGFSLSTSKSDSAYDGNEDFRQMDFKSTIMSGLSVMAVVLGIAVISSTIIYFGTGMKEFDCGGYYDPYDERRYAVTIDVDKVNDGTNDCYGIVTDSAGIDRHEPTDDGWYTTTDEYQGAEDDTTTSPLGWMVILLGVMVIIAGLAGLVTKIIADSFGTGMELHQQYLDGPRNVVENSIETSGTEEGNESLFAELDTDGDGVISKEELGAAGVDESRFAELDTDEDGVISKEEFDEFDDL